VDETVSNLKPLATSAAKLVLRGVKEAADAFPPLKSAAGALCFIVDNCEVWYCSNKPLDPGHSQPY
jgi:hypothetical protein